MPLTGFYFQAQNVAQWYCKRLRAFRLGQLGMAKDKCCCNFARNDKNGKGCCLGQRQLQCKRKNWPAEGHKNQWISFFFCRSGKLPKSSAKNCATKIAFKVCNKMPCIFGSCCAFCTRLRTKGRWPREKGTEKSIEAQNKIINIVKANESRKLGVWGLRLGRSNRQASWWLALGRTTGGCFFFGHQLVILFGRGSSSTPKCGNCKLQKIYLRKLSTAALRVTITTALGGPKMENGKQFKKTICWLSPEGGQNEMLYGLRASTVAHIPFINPYTL